MIGQKLDVVVLLDSDQAGDAAHDALVKKWLTRYNGKENQVLSLGRAVGVSGEFSIEDLFPEDFYLRRAKQVYAKALATAGDLKLQPGTQLCKRVERAFADLGLPFNKGSVSKVLRADLSRMKNVSELPAGMQKTVATVIGALQESFEALGPAA